MVANYTSAKDQMVAKYIIDHKQLEQAVTKIRDLNQNVPSKLPSLPSKLIAHSLTDSYLLGQKVTSVYKIE